MHQPGVAWAMLASLSAFVACGGSSDTPSNGRAGAAAQSSSGAGDGATNSAGAFMNGSSGSAGSLNDGGGAGAASASGAAATTAQGAGYTGTVQVGWQDNGQASNTSVRADFFVPSQPDGAICTTNLVGPCRISTCASGPDALTMPQAGLISVSNGEKLNATLKPNGDGSYPVHSEAGILLPGEDLITISATGGDVPAFSSKITQPLTLLVTAPLAMSTGQIYWPRDTDLALSFERGAPEVLMLVKGGASLGVSLACDFPSEAGEGLIPTAALQALPASAILSLFTYKAAQTTAGQYAITLKAFSSAMDPNKTHGILVHLQ